MNGSPYFPGQTTLTRTAILRALQSLSDEPGQRGATGEICLLGGTAMVIAFAARVSTKDEDALFRPTQVIREAAKVVAAAHALPAHWLNDAAKEFISARHDTTAEGLPQFPHLRLVMPTPEYLLAMKCMASRIGLGVGDTDDVAAIVFLIRHLKLQNAEAVMNIVTAYYPPTQIPVKTQFLVEGLFAEGRV